MSGHALRLVGASVLGEFGDRFVAKTVKAEALVLDSERDGGRPEKVLVDGAVVATDARFLFGADMGSDAEDVFVVYWTRVGGDEIRR